jgi:hypothetical protein
MWYCHTTGNHALDRLCNTEIIVKTGVMIGITEIRGTWNEINQQNIKIIKSTQVLK